MLLFVGDGAFTKKARQRRPLLVAVLPTSATSARAETILSPSLDERPAPANQNPATLASRHAITEGEADDTARGHPPAPTGRSRIKEISSSLQPGCRGW